MKRPRRPSRPGTGALALARTLALAPITAGAPNDTMVGGLVEPAWDGHRVLVTRVGDQVRLEALDDRDWTKMFPVVVRALAKLPVRSVALDAVVCALDEHGAPSFDGLRAHVAAGVVPHAVLICWDLLWVDDEDLRMQPLVERRRRLEAILTGAAGALVPSQALDGALTRVLAVASSLGLRGVVARRLDSTYESSWNAFSTSVTPVDWQRSLSPPPPLSNADKVLYPRDGICKRDIAGYYRELAPLLIPHLLDRPVVIQRWPDGIDAFDWYQHRVPPRAPDYLRAAWVDGVRRIVIENQEALAWMVNQAGLTFHGFASRLSTLTEPDHVIIDLDPGDRSTWWSDTIEVALGVRKLLELIELPSVVKTSGQRGLHILVPIGSGHTFEQTEDLAHGIATMLLRLMPDKVTLDNEKDKRRGRLLVDHKQFIAKTLVMPYSLRGVDGAPVSTPIGWDEVTPSLDPKRLTLRTLRARLDARGDLASPLLAGTARLDQALAKLGEPAKRNRATK